MGWNRGTASILGERANGLFLREVSERKGSVFTALQIDQITGTMAETPAQTEEIVSMFTLVVLLLCFRFDLGLD